MVRGLFNYKLPIIQRQVNLKYSRNISSLLAVKFTGAVAEETCLQHLHSVDADIKENGSFQLIELELVKMVFQNAKFADIIEKRLVRTET